MQPRDIPGLLPVVIPLIVVTVLFFRMRPGREARVHPGRLWIMPLLLLALIGSGLWFQPHPTPTPIHVFVLTVATLAGAAVGVLRSRGMRLRRGDDGLFVSSSRVAFVLIVVLILGRQLTRGYFDNSDATVVDAGMVFALAMVLTGRALLWRRIRRLPPLPAA